MKHRPTPPLHPKPGRPLGVYVHFPFCMHVCPYCDFAVQAARVIPHEAYADAVLAELEARASRFEGARLVSIYFGGGTPGLWSPSCVARVIRAICGRWPALDDAEDLGLAREVGAPWAVEVTVEVNPARAPLDHLRALYEAGVNRLSVGVQSFDDAYLARLGRDHQAAQARETLAQAHSAGFRRVSLDLIFGGPGQTLDDLDRDLAALGEQPYLDHASLYEMTFEPKTPFGRQLARGLMREAGEDTMAEMFERCARALSAQGYQHYEIGSHAKPGRWSRHNSLYWQGCEYMGLGVGAHELAYVDGVILRREGVGKAKPYLLEPTRARREERVKWGDHLFERFFLGLRTSFGVSVEDFDRQFGPQGAAYARRALEKAASLGYAAPAVVCEGAPSYLLPQGERWGPTPAGMQQADALALAVHPDELGVAL